MGFNSRYYPQSAKTASFASVATDSSEIRQLFAAERAGQVLSAIFWNSNAGTVASGTTAGSALNVYVYKTASGTASQVASARLGAVAALGTTALTMSTATALTRFSGGDVFLGELIGGVGNDNTTLGAHIRMRYMYGHARSDTATP